MKTPSPALVHTAHAAAGAFGLHLTTLETVTLPGGTIPPHDGRGPIHLALAVGADSLGRVEARLGAAGVAVEGRTHWPRGGESIYVRDPDGHLVEFATPGLWTTY